MFDDILLTLNGPLRDDPAMDGGAEPSLALAVALVLVDVRRVDPPRRIVDPGLARRELQRLLGLDALAAARLIRAAQRESERATSLALYTYVIARAFSFEQRVALARALWRIAYARGAVQPAEQAYVDRAVGLIGLSPDASHAARVSIERED